MFKLSEIVPFSRIEEATNWVNSVEGNYYLEDYEPDANGNMQLIVRQLPQPTAEEITAQTQERLTAAVQKVLDSEAQKLNYDNCLSVCSYIDTGVTKFDDEGKSFRAWRSAVWAKGYEILDEVVSGKREIPTEEELIAELPTLEIVYSKDVV